ncbi:hypothetical protein SAMN04487769_2019 [Burkholderia sp. b14]|nr:hypothetical protein SAMN04487769_2019 [Burkholderia sp. b14]
MCPLSWLWYGATSTYQSGTLVTGNPENEMRSSLQRPAGQAAHAAEAARRLGVERTFWRQIGRYKADGLQELIDKRLNLTGTGASTATRASLALAARTIAYRFSTRPIRFQNTGAIMLKIRTSSPTR